MFLCRGKQGAGKWVPLGSKPWGLEAKLSPPSRWDGAVLQSPMGTSYSEQVQRACHRPSHLARSPRGPEKPFRRPVNASLVSLGLPRPLLSFHLEDAQITLLQIHESCSCPGVVLRPPVRQSPAGGWVTNAGCGAPPRPTGLEPQGCPTTLVFTSSQLTHPP